MGTIISFDPGYSTGIVMARNIDYNTRNYDLFNAAIISFPFRAEIYSLIASLRYEIDTIIIEDFLLFESKALAQTGSRFEAVKVIERIVCVCEQLDLADRIKMQAPDLRLSARGMPPDHLAFLTSVAPDPKVRRHIIASYQHMRYFVFWKSNQLKKVAK